MRFFFTFFLALSLLGAPSFAQSPPTKPALHLDVSDDETHFSYSLSNPELVREAWIEILDRPLLLAKQSVPIQPNGTLDWEWDRSPINYYEQPEDTLVVSLWDPAGETISCDVNTVMTASPGGIVSSATVGARQHLTPYSRLEFSFLRVAPGDPAVTFPITGQDLSPSTKFTVSASYGAHCNARSLHVQVLDFAHARATLDSDCFQKPGRIAITLEGETADYFAELPSIHVAGAKSPQLLSVSPSSISPSPDPAQLKFVLRGRGFTPDSIVYAGFNPDAGDYMTDQLMLETEYVSPTELRARIISNSVDNDTFPLPSGEKMRFWVKGNEEKSELSAFREIPIQAGLHDAALYFPGWTVRRRWPQKIATLTSVSPYPIRLMNEHSPEELKVTIHGEHFVPEDKISFSFGSQATNDKPVRTEYVSPTLLHAWLPRQLWRKHNLTFRLVVLTNSGERLSSQVESSDDD